VEEEEMLTLFFVGGLFTGFVIGFITLALLAAGRSSSQREYGPYEELTLPSAGQAGK
jgi:hypothetical protein